MSVKYENPPVIYAVAKISFNDSIGSFSNEKYLSLRDEIESQGFEAYTKSSMMGVQVQHSSNEFNAKPSNIDRIGYFTAERDKAIVIDENSVELRVSRYTNHSDFLDCFTTVLDKCFNLGIAKGNKQRELDLHYVDIFAPIQGANLGDMLKNVSLPNHQFYRDETDSICLGSLNFIRVLESGRQKVEVNLEHINLKNIEGKKYLPESLSEPDPKLGMPLEPTRLFKDFSGEEYAIAHTNCSSLLDENTDVVDIRQKLEEMYKESRKTFDYMVNRDVCDGIWSIIGD
ncbi:TIGR04255 family protein [Vibrio diabolicus]|uniref:TIGR04255 family protein n=1 Tax=Vibrio harveyi group TaxID=717610 RepID=UPI00193F7E6D|nr:TIGR04255 family protein [Vibrio parahaemolyticus]